MRLEKVLVVAAAGLLATFLAQVGIHSYQSKPDTFASWRYYPKSVEEARKLSSHVVVGKVAGVRSGRLQPMDKEKFEEDVSLPAEVVTFRVENTFMGDKVEEVQLFHTGTGESTYNRPEPREKPPEAPKGAVPKSQRPPKPTEEQARPVLLMDDPPYREGESYLLFLMDGPEVAIDGSPVKTMTIISPEGRYRITANGTLTPVSSREGLPKMFRGKNVKELEAMLRR